MAKHDEDLQDVSFIFNDLLRFAAMTSDKRKRHLEEHPEDKMHCVDMRGHHPISREAARRFSHLAKRQRAIDPDEHTIDLLKWYSYSGHSEKRVMETSFKEVPHGPETKELFKTIQD